MEGRKSLPMPRYLLKLREKCDVAAVTSYVVGRLEERGMQCFVEGRHIIVSAIDSGTLLSQASSFIVRFS